MEYWPSYAAFTNRHPSTPTRLFFSNRPPILLQLSVHFLRGPPYRRGPCQPEDCPYRREHLFPELIGGFRTCYCPEGAPIPFSNRSFWPLISPFCHRRNSTLPKSPFLLPLLPPPPLPPHHHPKPLPKRSPRRRQFSPSSSRNSMRLLRRRSSGRLRLSCPIWTWLRWVRGYRSKRTIVESERRGNGSERRVNGKMTIRDNWGEQERKNEWECNSRRQDKGPEEGSGQKAMKWRSEWGTVVSKASKAVNSAPWDVVGIYCPLSPLLCLSRPLTFLLVSIHGCGILQEGACLRFEGRWSCQRFTSSFCFLPFLHAIHRLIHR